MRHAVVLVSFIIIVTGTFLGTAQAQPVTTTINGRTVPYIPHVLPTEAGGPTQSIQAKAPVRHEAEIRDETMKLALSSVFIALVSSTIILFILGCGSRILVFADASDAMMTACIFIAPIVTAVAFYILAALMGFERIPSYPSVWIFAKETPVLAFTLGAGLLWWAWAVIGTVVSSIRYNGLVIGLMVALLKLGAVFTMLFAWFASEHARTPGYRGVSYHAFFLVVLAWFASRYVNGHRVMERREMLMQATGQTIAEA